MVSSRRHAKGGSRHRQQSHPAHAAWLGGGPQQLDLFRQRCGRAHGSGLAKLRGVVRTGEVDPFVWFHDVLARIASHSISRLEELLSHRWAQLPQNRFPQRKPMSQRCSSDGYDKMIELTPSRNAYLCTLPLNGINAELGSYGE